MVEEVVVVCERAAGGDDGEVAGILAPELGSGGDVGALDAAVELGAAGRQHDEGKGRRALASSKPAMNSLPPSTWMEWMSMRRRRASRKRLALKAVAAE